MTLQRLGAPKLANRLSKIVETYSSVHKLDRFPVDIERLALGVHELFGWNDPITDVKAADIQGFEGCLLPNDNRSKWLLLYNSSLRSSGRIRFTQAHELGHYLLHRLENDTLRCTENDMANWSKDEFDLEGQADQFASYLLMPLDDYRRQISDEVNLDVFMGCADRYGVSLTAAILKWLDYTTQKALIVYSTDGFINWAWSSEPAFKAGAYFKTRNLVVPVPPGTLATDERVQQDLGGRNIAANLWFRHAEKGMPLREMKLVGDRLGCVISVLVLPNSASVWPPRDLES